MDNTKFMPVCMAEEFWACSQFSLARHTGSVRINGHGYVIVNKELVKIYNERIKEDKS